MITSGTVTVDQIRERAYELWQADGCPEGRDVEYWLRAEADLKGESRAGAEAGDGPGGGEAKPMDEPAAPRPSRARPRKPASTDAPAAEDAATDAEGRAGYVQQKRTRRKAEG